MNGIIDFLLRASISLSILYLVYWFFLRKQTLFKVTRYYLTWSLVISIILPLIRIRYEVVLPGNGLPESQNGLFNGTGLIGSLEAVTTGGIITLILGSIYFLGVTFFLARLIWQILILINNVRRHGYYVKEQVRIVENSRYSIPFSFFHYVFINPQYINTDELENIIAHEKVHIRENHWFDLLIVELTTVFFWFNPFVWLFDRSIKQNHEYLADEGVIAQGYSIGRYHSILLNQLLGMEVLCMANHLNYSLNAKRLKMIKQKKTPKLRALHIIWSIPALLILLVAFAKPTYTTSGDNPSQFISIDGERNIKLSIQIKDPDGDPLPGANGVIKGTEIGSVSDKDGKMNFNVSKDDVVIISYVGFEKAVIKCEKLGKAEKKEDSLFGLVIVMKPSKGELSEEEMKKELIKKKEAELKKKQMEQENGENGSVENILMKKLKDVETVMKKISMKQKKLEEMENDESVDKTKLAAQQKELQVKMVELKKKRAAIEKELEKLK